jgi:hypothetical protein
VSDQRDITQREIDVARDKANAGGPAQSYARVRTNRAGTRLVGKRIDFGCTFIQKPWVSYGVECSPEDVEEAGFEVSGGSVGGSNAGEYDAPRMPLSMGYVTDWDLDNKDHYTGCWVAVYVQFPAFTNSSGSAGPIPMTHHFTFAGLALKDISDSAVDLTPTDDSQG